MPWYWTDDIARALMEAGRITSDVAAAMLSVPTAIRRTETSIEELAEVLLDDEEIPIAA